MPDLPTSQLLPVVLRVIQIVAGVMLLLTAGYTVLAFLRALLVKHRPLRPLPAPSHPASQGLQSLVALANEAGFQSVGLWTDAEEDSHKGRTYTLMLSPDACILFRVRHDKLSPPYGFITPFADGRRVITSIADDEADLSGLDDEQWFPRGFHAMLSRHRARIAAASSALLVFSPDTMTRHLREHEQTRLNRLVAAKLAKLVLGQQAQWRYTLRGAARQASVGLRRVRQMLADQRKQPEKLRLER